MEGANKEVDPNADDRKGGAGAYGKIFMSAGKDALIILAYVPKDLSSEMNITEWMEKVLVGTGGKIVGEIYNDGTMLRAEAKADTDNNLFPLKMRDSAMGQGFDYLRKRGLVVDEDSDDDVDYESMYDAAGIEW